MIIWEEAVKSLKEGKKVRQATWDDDFYIYIDESNTIQLSESYANYLKSPDFCPAEEVRGAFGDTLNNDWEIVE